MRPLDDLLVQVSPQGETAYLASAKAVELEASRTFCIKSTRYVLKGAQNNGGIRACNPRLGMLEWPPKRREK